MALKGKPIATFISYMQDKKVTIALLANLTDQKEKK